MMKAHKIPTLIFLLSLVALLGCVLIEGRQVKKLTAFITKNSTTTDKYREYIMESFTYGISEDDQEILDKLISDYGNSIVIAAPNSMCWACFESLVNRVIESKTDLGAITIIFSDMDPMRERVLRAKGFSNVFCNPAVDSLPKITLSRVSNNGWQHIYMNYSDGQEEVLDLFIQ